MSRTSKKRRDIKIKKKKQKLNSAIRKNRLSALRKEGLAKGESRSSLAKTTIISGNGKSNKTCYMCELEGNTTEHVPPRCLFPETKDLPNGINLRKELITVPSCSKHNNSTSKDDEYILYIFVMSITSNNIAINQFKSKVLRAINRNPSLILKFLDKHKEVTIKDNTTEQYFKSLAVDVNNKRFKSVMDKIARALHYHHFGHKFLESIQIIPDFIVSLGDESSKRKNELLLRYSKTCDKFFAEKEYHGKNPEVFKYQVFDGNNEHSKMLRLYFYEDSKVTITFG